MDSDEQGDTRGDVIARLLELAPGPERRRLLEELPESERTQVESMLAAADLLWEDAHHAADLTHDPVAAALGLVPDAGYQLDPGALKRARTKASLKPTQLAAALSSRGWSVSAGEVLRWERRSSPHVSPAMVRAVATILRTNPDRLVTTHAPALHATAPRAAAASATLAASVAATVVNTPAFAALVERFAALYAMTPRMASSALQSRMLATVHRGDQPDAEQMLSSVQALVEALESK